MFQMDNHFLRCQEILRESGSPTNPLIDSLVLLVFVSIIMDMEGRLTIKKSFNYVYFIVGYDSGTTSWHHPTPASQSTSSFSHHTPTSQASSTLSFPTLISPPEPRTGYLRTQRGSLPVPLQQVHLGSNHSRIKLEPRRGGARGSLPYDGYSLMPPSNGRSSTIVKPEQADPEYRFPLRTIDNVDIQTIDLD